MKIAAFNVENLFDRPKVFNQEKAVSTPILKAIKDFGEIAEKDVYTKNDRKSLLTSLSTLKLLKTDLSKYAILRRNRGKFIKRPRTGSPSIVANGRNDWIGWLELKHEEVREVAVENTARVIRDVDADILAVIEAEDRISLKMFNDDILGSQDIGGNPYEHTMVIDGNDGRGIDVGVMTKKGFSIDMMRSHVDDLNSQGRPIFSRDCPEFAIQTPGGDFIWILPNHFKSKFGGDSARSRARRKKQAERTAEIYQNLIEEGWHNIIVLGDLNDTPDSDPLKPLLIGTDLKDVSDHPSFDPGEYSGKGTYASGTDRNKIDYLLLSPSLYDLVKSSGLFRKGAWAGKRRKKWPMYPEIKTEKDVASDHHVIWVELDMT